MVQLQPDEQNQQLDRNDQIEDDYTETHPKPKAKAKPLQNVTNKSIIKSKVNDTYPTSNIVPPQPAHSDSDLPNINRVRIQPSSPD